MNKYMMIALKEAKKSYQKGDVPVGAVIVKNDKIIAKAHNLKEKKKIASYHAEILVINKACKKLNTWYLDDCVLYTTMEPCMMCCGAIQQSRIKKIVYATENIKYGTTKQLNNVTLVEGINKKESQKMLNNFFKNKRKDVSRET